MAQAPSKSPPPASVRARRAERTRKRSFQVYSSVPLSRGLEQSPIRGTGLSLRGKQFLFHQGQPATRLFEVTSGILVISKLSSDGRQQLIEIATPGWICGFSNHGSYDTSCEAVRASTVIAYEKDAFERAERNPDRKRIGDQMEKQICALHEYTFSLGQKNAKEQIATLLLRLIPAWGVPNCLGPNSSIDGIELSLPLSRKQIGQYLGLTVETVSRTITELVREGFIARQEKNRKAILISDVCKLCRLAQGNCVSEN